MSPSQFEKEMRKIHDNDDFDTEDKHRYMDNLMAEVLKELGYSKGIQIFVDTDKWYV